MTISTYCNLEPEADDDGSPGTTSTGMRALQSSSLGYWASGDVPLLHWLQKDSCWMNVAPVFGTGRMQKIYMILIVAQTFIQCEYLFFNWNDVRSLASAAGADTGICKFLCFLPVMSMLAIGKFYYARLLLKSRSLEDMHLQVLRTDEVEALEKAKVTRRIRWSTALPLGLSVIFIYVVCWHFQAPPRFCYRFILMWFWVAAIGHVANFAIYYALQVGIARVDVMAAELTEMQQKDERPDGYFVRMINQYWELDEHLTKVTKDSGHIVAIVVGMTMSGGYIALLLFIVLEDIVLQLFCIAILVGAAYAAFITIWPFAKLSDRCSSSSSLLKKPSLSMQIMLLGKLHMSQKETLEYLKLVHIVKAAPIGAKLPIFGLITTGELLTYAKVLSAMLPTLMARSLAQMEEAGSA